MNALRVGHHEEVKAAVHGVLGAIAGVCAVYNASALVEREDFEPHLLVNTVLYTLLAAWEVQHVVHHWQARCSR